MYPGSKKCRRNGNVNKDKDLYSCFVLVVIELRVSFVVTAYETVRIKYK